MSRTVNCYATLLKRNIIRIYIIFRVLNTASPASCHVFGRCLIIALASARRTGAATARFRTELHAVGDDFGAVLFLAVLLPASRLHAAFHEDRASLPQVLIHEVRLAA